MIRTPAHKQTDSNKLPGQIVNRWTRMEDEIKYYENVNKPKLTFEEWFNTKHSEHGAHLWDLLEKIWKAAQENK